LKILFFHTYNRGYLSRFFHELAAKLKQEGHEVISFTWKNSKSERIIDGVKVIVKKKKGYLVNYRNVYTIIKRERPEVILSNFSYVNPALLFGKLFQVKKNMVWFHSLNAQMESSKLQVFIKKQFLKLADTVIANSFITKGELHKDYAVPDYKLTALPFWSTISEQEIQPTDLKFTARKDVIKIGCPGRMASHKNQNVVIEALSAINNTYNYDFYLYFAGSGEELNNLETKVAKENLIDKVTFLDHLSSNDMIAFYNAMDVIILPSLHEAFGLVFIEAISLGKPLIVSSQFGALSFIDHEKYQIEKITFNPESISDLEEKLILHFKNESLTPKEIKKMYSDNFNKNVVFESFYNLISD